MNKSLIIPLSAIAFASTTSPVCGADIAYYTFDNVFTSSDVETNSIASFVTTGGGFSPIIPVFSNTAISGRSLAPQGITESTEADAIADGDYLEFTITPEAGFGFDLTALSVYLQRSSDGSATNWFLRSSIDSFTSNIGSVEPTLIFENYTFDLSGSEFQNISTSVTFRAYAYGGNPDGASASLRHDNLIVDGTLSTIPEPQTFGILIGVVALGSVIINRRRSGASSSK